jgi:hypothetical protein
MDEPLTVRSYRRVFRVDRRIYRVDRWALPVPGGVPLLAVGYFAAALGVMLLAGELPVIGDLVRVVSPPLRFVVAPLAVAVLGMQAAPDGRVAHRFAMDWLRFRLRSKRRCSGRTVRLEGEPQLVGGVLATTWDAHATSLHRGRVIGPAKATFTGPVRLSVGRHGVSARPGRPSNTPGVVVLGVGEPLEVSG